MQYGVEVPTYKRLGNENVKEKISLSTLTTIVLFVFIGFMLSRIGFELVDGLYIAPFGISYMMSIVTNQQKDKNMIIALFSSLGYLSMSKVNEEWFVYVCIVAMIFIIRYVCSMFSIKIKNNKIILLSGILFLILSTVVGNQSLIMNTIFSVAELAIIVPFYYVLNYGINCLEEFNTGYLFSNEELISIAILLCLVIAGIGSISLFGVELINVVAISVVIIIAYSCGIDIGAAIGITMGVITGIVTNNVMEATCLYGICGIVVGIFKESGKIVSTLSYIIIAFIINVYSSGIRNIDYVELIIPAILMFSIPLAMIKKILCEINNQEKDKILGEIQVEGVKIEFLNRVEALKSVLGIVGKSIEGFTENDNLLMKNKGTAMVENLADRVCANCDMNRKCWDRELHSTFNSFTGLMLSCESKKTVIPKELEKKCIQRGKLVKNAEDIFNVYSLNAVLKSRLAEGRKLVVNQINNISNSLEDIFKEFENDMTSCLEIDKLLRKTLNKNNIEYNDIYSYTDKKGRLKIKINVDNSNGEVYCTKKIIPVISALVKTPLNIIEEESRISPETNECIIIIEETARYNVISKVASNSKDGEKYSGDSYNFGKNINGEYVTILSDGMGSGPEAGMESEVVIDLVEKLIECGFSEITTLNTINSIMAMKFDGDEKFATLDMNTIDLYSGEASFIKVGSTASFIKNEAGVEVIDGSSLPFGILDNIDVDIIDKKLKSGDIIVTISDGVLDVDRNKIDEYKWLEEYLGTASINPEELSRDILEKAKELSGGKVRDDMTVVVSKVYSSY